MIATNIKTYDHDKYALAQNSLALYLAGIMYDVFCGMYDICKKCPILQPKPNYISIIMHQPAQKDTQSYRHQNRHTISDIKQPIAAVAYHIITTRNFTCTGLPTNISKHGTVTPMRIPQAMTARGLYAIIPGGISARDYGAVAEIETQDAHVILDWLQKSGIGSVEDDVYYFEEGDRLKAAIMLLEDGAPLDRVAEAIEWKEFEGLASEVLASKDFVVMRNFRLKKPPAEIDVVGVRMGVTMLVDCKHWKYTARSAISEIVTKQIERTRRYVADTPGSVAVPVIVTLHQHETEFVENVPIVPISKFASFVDEFYGNLDSMRTVNG